MRVKVNLRKDSQASGAAVKSVVSLPGRSI